MTILQLLSHPKKNKLLPQKQMITIHSKVFHDYSALISDVNKTKYDRALKFKCVVG